MSLHHSESWKHPPHLPTTLSSPSLSHISHNPPSSSSKSSAPSSSSRPHKSDKSSSSSHSSKKEHRSGDRPSSHSHKPHSKHPPGNGSTTSSPPSPSTPPSPLSPPLPPLRVDLSARQSHLQSLLGPHSSSYWSTIDSFLRAQLSKGELDTEVTRLLGVDGVYAHNDFFFALLQNAMSDDLPRVGGVDGVKKEAGESASGAATPTVKGGKGEGDKVKKEETVKEREVREKKEKAAAQAQLKELKKGQKDGKAKGKDGKDIKAEAQGKAGLDSKGAKGKKDGVTVKGEKEVKKEGKKGKEKRKGGRLSDDEEDAIDWTEPHWPQPTAPSRYSALPLATLHREMKHVTTASDYFALMKQIGRARGAGPATKADEKEDWMYAVGEDGERGYLRVPYDDEDEPAASVQGVLQLLRRRQRKTPLQSGAEERAEAEEVAAMAWLDPGSSLAYMQTPPSLPSVSALRGRCLLIARHGGLKTVTESAMQLIHAAMEQHVRALVTEMIGPVEVGGSGAAQVQVTVKEEKVDVTMGTDETTGTAPMAPKTAAETEAGLASHFSSFPPSCFGLSIFAARSVTPPPASSAPLADQPAALTTEATVASLLTAPPSSRTDVDMAEAASAIPVSASAPVSGPAADAAVPMDVEGAATNAPPAAGPTASSPPATTPAANLPTIASPTPPRRALSVSVPISPTSAQSTSITSPTPIPPLLRSSSSSSSPGGRPRVPAHELGSFPFLIARPPAYRPPPRSETEEKPHVSREEAPREQVGRGGGAGSGSMLSLNDLMACLYAEGERGVRRLADDLPLLLERLLIVQ